MGDCLPVCVQGLPWPGWWEELLMTSQRREWRCALVGRGQAAPYLNGGDLCSADGVVRRGDAWAGDVRWEVRGRPI